MLLKEDIDRLSRMSENDIDDYLKTEEYSRMSEKDKIDVLRILTSNIELDNNNKSFEEFAEEILVEERIFDLGIELNEDNYRKIRREIREEKGIKD